MTIEQQMIYETHLHDFCRISWVSEEAKAYWYPRIQCLTTLFQNQAIDLTTKEVFPLLIKRLYPHEVDELSEQLQKSSLEINHLRGTREKLLEIFPITFLNDQVKETILIGKKKHVDKALEAFNKSDSNKFLEIIGMPICCIKSYLEGLQTTIHNGLLRTILKEQKKKELNNQLLSYLLYKPLGLDLLQYEPCFFDCQQSERNINNVINTLVEKGYNHEMFWLKEILSWPISWSGLHGIAEVKTPINKFMYNIDATAKKVELIITGSNYPKLGAKGLAFPYRINYSIKEVID